MDFDAILKKIEDSIEPSDEFIVSDLGKIDRWLTNRCGRITSSTLPNLMKAGRGKNCPWGETAKKELYAVKYEIRTGKLGQTKDYINNFKFGKEHEPNAIEWLRANGYADIIHSDDGDDIIFNAPFDGFGDSPDFIGNKLVGEIKCHVDIAKIEQYRDTLTFIDEGHENYWQLLGHFVGDPTAEKLLFVSYDAFNNDAHVVEMLRSDHVQNIDKLTDRILDGLYVIKESLVGGTTIGEINEFLAANPRSRKELPRIAADEAVIIGFKEKQENNSINNFDLF